MHGTGILELLNSTAEFFSYREANTEAAVSGTVFKVEYDPGMGKTAHIRLYQGVLRNRDSVILSNGREEKITQIRKFSGGKYKDTGLIEAGDIAAVCGLSSVSVGDTVGTGDGIPRTVKWVAPLLTVSVSPADKNALPELIQALSILNEEDPLLGFYTSNETRELLLNITGYMQTQVLTALLRERFQLDVIFGKPSVIYKETPIRDGEGYDSYTMPKPCWAVVKFKIEPGLRGSGIVYQSEVSPNKIPYRYQHHVETAVYRALSQGLKGWEVVDAKITLIDGEYHNVHTHPLDFFVATPIALMKGLQNTGTALLEPMLSFRMIVPEEFSGKIIGEIINMRGEFESPTIQNGRLTITGIFPAAASLDFPIRLASITSGQGILSTRFHSYKKCPEEVDASMPYRGVNPLDRSKFILWARNAYEQG
jgi:ribosomal protection tetracycline resistance protein